MAGERDERQDLERFFEMSVDMLAIAGVDGFFRRVNPACDALGYSREELLARPFIELAHPEDRASILAEVAKLATGVRTIRFESRIRRKDGTYRWLAWTCAPDEARTTLFAVLRDVTEQKQLEAERQGVVERLRELDALKTRLVSHVSHELRTPLAIILLITEQLLRSPALAAPLRADLQTIDGNAKTLIALVKNLLDAWRREAGKLTPHYARADLAELVRLTARSFEPSAREGRVALDVTVPDTLPAELDPDQIHRVVTNLLSNAFKHVPPDGTVRCALERAGASARITVSDSGRGIPPELRERVFERFYQIEGDPSRSGGTGLGLPIARELTELHGGRVALDQGPEGGARFTVELPLAAPAGTTIHEAVAPRRTPEAPLIAGAPTDAGPAEAPAAVGADERPVVLVVEDHPDLRRILETTLSARYRVFSAQDGQEGLERVSVLSPDLVVTDLMMPRLSGEQMIAALRAQPSLDAMPIVVLTARDDDALRVDLLRRGADDYVNKPFSSDELLARVANLVAIKRTRDVLQQELVSGRQDIESLARDLARRGRELQTAYEIAAVSRAQAEAGSKAKSEFLAAVSHELRTPLTSLRLRLELLDRAIQPSLDPSQSRQLRRMVASAERLCQLAASLLEAASLESGRVGVHLERVELTALASDVLDELRPQAEEKQLELRLSATEGLAPIDTDRRMIRLVLTSLVENAVKFTARGSVVVALSEGQGAHRIEVRDTGPGIPDEARDAIFAPFATLEPVGHKHHRGLGLGLAVVARTVAALGGEVKLESEVGLGSTFVVTLPSRSVRAGTAQAVELVS